MEKATEVKFKRKGLLRLIGRYITEIVIIFIGITISFMFDKWRDQVSNQQKQREFVQSLISDLKFKLDEVQFEAKSQSVFFKNVEDVFRSVQNKNTIPNSIIDHVLKTYDTDNNFFQSSTPTFNSSITTEQFQQLPDSLRREIFEVYSLFEYLRLSFERVANARANFNEVMAAKKVFYARGVFQSGSEVVKPNWRLLEEFIQSPEFVNNLRLIWGYEVRKQEILKGTYERLTKLTSSLTRYLAKF